MRSDAETVDEYLDRLDEGRRSAIEEVRRVVLDSLPDGYEEVMNWGMIAYQVPLQIEPDTYNGKPLMYASQENHMALYLTAVHVDDDAGRGFRQAYRETGKRLDIGKSCVRFRRPEDLPLDLIGGTIAASPLDEFVDMVRRSR